MKKKTTFTITISVTQDDIELAKTLADAGLAGDPVTLAVEKRLNPEYRAMVSGKSIIIRKREKKNGYISFCGLPIATPKIVYIFLKLFNKAVKRDRPIEGISFDIEVTETQTRAFKSI